jgi:hypothetical protein
MKNTFEYKVFETQDGFDVSMMRNDVVIQVVARTNNRRKALRLVERFSRKDDKRNDERLYKYKARMYKAD